MSIRNQAELEKLRTIGRIVRKALDKAAQAVRPGITTAELDAIGRRVLDENGAESAPPKVYGFPGALCISVNEEAIHGIPGGRAIAAGDLVKLDLVAEKDGFYADAAVTVMVGRSPSVRQLWCGARKVPSGWRLKLRARATAFPISGVPWSARPPAAASVYCANYVVTE
ncbi:MAG TPA: M24 family metallopeptidase [Bryobacteraceae bacterium]|jgi:methionyl aminopeptidase|nr:M24 family metallopeptidase [Bryobacteraceae bacterium]